MNFIKKIVNKNIFFEYIIYAAYRCLCLLYSALFLIFRIFPIQENKIVSCNMKGNRYGDNPKYILDEIIRQNLDFELVWLMKENSCNDLPSEVRQAPYHPVSIAYHLSTAKIWIDSHTKNLGVLKRKGQIYLQTWHGSYGLKKFGYESNPNIFDRKFIAYNAKLYDVVLSNSKLTTQIYRSALTWNGEFLECGSPRNDIFYQDNTPIVTKIHHIFNIPTTGKIVLYAPTFRKDFSVASMRLDYERLLKSLEKRFNGDWYLLIRLHPQNMKDAANFITYTNHIINATDYNIMQELLVAADVLISDYSSCMFDYINHPRPCFIYATDIDDYKDSRGFHLDIHELPFPVAKNNEELEECILQFDFNAYHTKIKELHKAVGLLDAGNACAKTVNYIQRKVHSI